MSDCICYSFPFLILIKREMKFRSEIYVYDELTINYRLLLIPHLHISSFLYQFIITDRINERCNLNFN